ncbi:MAG TPA: acetyltransferase, partial [Isosphaeraceae bacterium]|nr:acetyltransferase [Isosphaeraceae bacterium]
MPLEIRPTTLEDLPALSRFLSRGFGLPEDAEAVAPDVLAWKYLEPLPRGLGCSSLVALDAAGAPAGHLAFTRTFWRQAGCDQRVSTLHMIDWLAGPDHRGVGSQLMRRAHACAQTQYGLGGSEVGRSVIFRAGYRPRTPVPVFRRILRPSWRLRDSDPNRARRFLRVGREALRVLVDRPSKGNPAVSLHQVERFGPETDRLVDRVEPPLLFSDRSADRLNGLLSYPRGGPVGHRVER